MAANPGLFDATAFAHHPYSFFLAPSAQMSDVNFVPLSDLSRLEHGLDAIFGAYGVGRRLPLYLTEYGYETNPPNPYRGVSPATQALYINEAEYMAWRDPRVRAMSQFLLYDALPDTRYPRGSERYWSTFQTGLRYADGTAKPSLGAYRVPIFVPNAVLGSGSSVFVWGRVRPASHGSSQRAQIQWAGPRRRVPHGRDGADLGAERGADEHGPGARAGEHQNRVVVALEGRRTTAARLDSRRH